MADTDRHLKSSASTLHFRVEHLFAAVKLPPLELSALCNALVIESVRSLPLKRAERKVISSTTFFFDCVSAFDPFRSGTRRSGNGPPPIGFHRLAGGRWRDAGPSRRGILQQDPELLGESALPATLDEISFSGLTMGEGLQAVLAASSDFRPLGSDQLVTLLLQDERTGISHRIRSEASKKDPCRIRRLLQLKWQAATSA